MLFIVLELDCPSYVEKSGHYFLFCSV